MHVSRMTQLAREGSGLATYISRRVGQRYAARLDEGAPGRAGSRAHGAAGTRTDARQSSTRQNTAFR
jgi:hypothetical protein